MHIICCHIEKEEIISQAIEDDIFDGDVVNALADFRAMLDYLQNELFIKILIDAINYYQESVLAEDDFIYDLWISEMVAKHGVEIICYGAREEDRVVVPTTQFIEFAVMFMELVFNNGVKEIYHTPVEELKVGNYGRIEITFEALCLHDQYSSSDEKNV